MKARSRALHRPHVSPPASVLDPACQAWERSCLLGGQAWANARSGLFAH